MTARPGLVAVALVPKLGCPLCWPALAALCGVLGVRFTVLDAGLLWANALSLLAVLWMGSGQGYGLAAAAVLSASLSYRLGAGLAPSVCMGLLVALLAYLTRRLTQPCCHSN